MRAIPCWTLLPLLAALGCPGGGGGGAGPAASADALDQAKARGKLLVAMDVGYDPFEVVTQAGDYEGYDVDLCREVAKDLGLELELKNMAWDGIIAALKTGMVDAIASGMSITDERKQVVAFTRPYYLVGQVVVKRKGDARVGSWQDLNAEGMVVATQQGTTGEFAIEAKMPKAKVLRFEKADEACLAVIQGQADAVVFDHPFLQKYVAGRSDALEGLWEPFTSEPIGVALRPDSPKLLAAFEATLDRLEQSGELSKLQARWFPAPAAAAASPPPAGGD